MCEYVGSLIKCSKLIKAEVTVANSRDKREIDNALYFINTHILNVMHNSSSRSCYIHSP